MTTEEIRELAGLVADLVLERLGARDERPELATKGELARVLRVEPASIDRWVRQGMPCAERGSYRLFDRVACEAWVSARPKPERPRRPPPAASPLPVSSVVELKTRTRKAG